MGTRGGSRQFPAAPLLPNLRDLSNAEPDARDDSRRSRLQVAEPRQTLSAPYRMRDSLYRECAHATVDTTAHDIARATANVLTVLHAW